MALGPLRLAFLALALLAPAAHAAEPQPTYGMAMHGAPAYPPDFTHFAYVLSLIHI